MTLDCSDLDIVVEFWRRALGYAERSGASEEAAFRSLFAPPDRSGLHHLTIQQVPERKTTKNRAHLDLFVEDVQAEVERLRTIGATVLRDVYARLGRPGPLVDRHLAILHDHFSAAVPMMVPCEYAGSRRPVQVCRSR